MEGMNRDLALAHQHSETVKRSTTGIGYLVMGVIGIGR